MKFKLKNLFSRLLVFILVMNSFYAQGQIIDLADPEFIDVPTVCETNLTDANCVITLPSYEYGKPYSFEVPIMNLLNRTLTNFTITNPDFECTLAETYSTLNTTTNGIITLEIDSLCGLKYPYIDYEITFNLNVDYPDSVSESLKCKIPISRQPVKVALVLDISGSMNLTTSEGPKRWEVLRNCTKLFTRELENFRLNDNDSVSVTYFTNSIIEPVPPLSPNFNLITPNTATTRVSSLIDNDIGDRSPLYSTAMGQGLLSGKNKLLMHDAPQHNKIVLLFTDGLQNVPPFVLEDGITLSNNDSLNKINENIKYYTIATWGTGIVPEVLDSISKNNNGLALQSGNVSNFELFDFFYNQLQYMLYQGSPQIIESKKGILNYNEDTLNFPINKHINKVSVVIAKNINDSINIKTISLGGIDIPLRDVVEKSNNFIFIDFELPLAISAAQAYGNLKIVLNGKTENEYMATALVDDHYLDVNSSTNQSQYTVGDSMLLNTKLSYVNQPITNDNTVKAYVFKPGDDINHLLAIYNSSDTTNYNDIDSWLDQKYISLLKTDTSFYNALLPDKQIVTLQHNGNGVYSGHFTATELSGNYKVLFIASGNINEGNSFKRSQTLTTIFRFGHIVQEEPSVEEDVTKPDTTSNSNQTSHITKVTIKPTNKYGYYMGPGFKSKIKYTVHFNKKPVLTKQSSSHLTKRNEDISEPYVKDFTDNLDGSYTLILANVPAGSNPDISFTVRGEKMYDGKLYKIPWWFYVIIIVILLLLIALKKAKSSNSVKLAKIILWAITTILIILYILHTMGIFKLFFL